VYQVRKVGTNEVYAMKEMSKEIIERENLLEHTFAEKSILQKINHPYIVKLHYAFQTKDKLFLVLDFLSGGELFYHLGQCQKFPEYRAKIYAAEIGLAIGHLHSLDIIYRDLKPENAVLDRDGHVVITDFGLAKTNVRGATSAKTFCGTPEYLAPEFLIGSGHGKAVDWWSLGVLLYEMMCGIPPFYSEDVTTMYDLILKKPLEFPPDLSPAAQDILRKLLDRNPQTRMQDVEKFKAHPFFADISFDALLARKVPAPFKPDSNAVNFEAEFTSMKAALEQEKAGKAHAQIAGFTYDEQKK
jgi:serum/glucocorticoid-regulated kinase 2